MKNIKTLICNEIITKGNSENIVNIINNILNYADSDKNIDLLVDLYINHDKFNHDTLFKKFKESIESYYAESLYPKKCLAYLLEQEVKKIEQVPVSVICDRCGRDKQPYEDFIEIRHEFGYGTDRDGNYIEADICETCIIEVLKTSNVKFREYKGI